MDRFGTSDLRELSEEPECLPLCPQVGFEFMRLLSFLMCPVRR